MFKHTSSGIPTCSVSLLLQYSSRLISSRASQEPQERFDDARLATGLTRTPAEQRNNGRNDKASEPKRHDKVERTELCYLLSSLCPARLGSGNHRLFLPVRFIVATPALRRCHRASCLQRPLLFWSLRVLSASGKLLSRCPHPKSQKMEANETKIILSYDCDTNRTQWL